MKEKLSLDAFPLTGNANNPKTAGYNNNSRHSLSPPGGFSNLGTASLASFCGACLGGEKTLPDLAQAGPMTEAIILGTVALQEPDVVVQWEADKMKTPNYPKAEKIPAPILPERMEGERLLKEYFTQKANITHNFPKIDLPKQNEISNEHIQ